MGLHILDICVLVLYLLGMVAIGAWSARKIRNSADFFMPRRFGKAMMIMFSFGTGTHSDQAVSVAAKSYTNGLSGIWYQWLWLPVTPFYWLIAPVFRRFRAITTSDVFEARFSPSVAMLFAVVGVMNLAVNIGVMLKGSSAVISASTGGLVSSNLAILIMTIIFVVYGVAGGLSAAIITDFIQGVLTIVFSFLLLPLVLNAVGGLAGVRAGITDNEMFKLVAPGEIGFFYVIVIAFNALVGIVTQPHTMGNCAAGKTEMEGRIGFMGGTLIKRFCTVPWCLTGLAAVVYFAKVGRTDIKPDDVFGAVAGDFLPKIMPGILGIFIAAILASVMSSCDAFMISSSALFTENVYKRLLPNRSGEHYVTVGRLTAVAVVTGGVVFAFLLPNVVKGLEIFWKISPMMGIAFWLGLFWRRATPAGAWAATLTAFAIWWLTTLFAVICFVGHIPHAKGARFLSFKERRPIYELHDCHLKNGPALTLKLRAGQDPVSSYVQTELSDATKELLSRYDGSTSVSKELRKRLLVDLNRLIEQGKLETAKEEGNAMREDDESSFFYTRLRFANVALSEKTRQLVSLEPEGDSLVQLNRRLLEEAYPEEIARSWKFCKCDFREPRSLAKSLREHDDPVALHVWGRLSDTARQLIESEEYEDITLSSTLAEEFNQIAAGESIYEKERFEIVFTTDESMELAKKKPIGEDLAKLNTYLLEEAFFYQIVKNRKAEIYMPWQMVFYLSGGLVAGIVVSLLTKPVDGEKLDRFYALARTPVAPGEKVDFPCTLPGDAVVPPKRNIFPNSSLEIPVPSVTSVIGFLAGWACVAVIIYAVYVLAGA